MSSSITSEENISDKDKSLLLQMVPDASTSSIDKKRSASDADLSTGALENRVAARREANRMHALKSRQRSKALLEDLQNTNAVLNREKADLERQNAVLRAQVDVLSQQNRALLQSQQQLLAGSTHQNPQGVLPAEAMQQELAQQLQQQQRLENASQHQAQHHRQQQQLEQEQQAQQQRQHLDQSQSSSNGQQGHQLSQQQLYAAAYGGGSNFSNFLQQPFLLDANTLTIMQTLQQAQLQQQHQQLQQQLATQQHQLPEQHSPEEVPLEQAETGDAAAAGGSGTGIENNLDGTV